MSKSDLNQVVVQPPAYIIVTMSYSSKLILPIETGLEFIKTWASGIELDEHGYGEDKKITLKKVERDMTISFLTEEKFKEMKMMMYVDPVEDS
jgi:hypothetical protein